MRSRRHRRPRCRHRVGGQAAELGRRRVRAAGSGRRDQRRCRQAGNTVPAAALQPLAHSSASSASSPSPRRALLASAPAAACPCRQEPGGRRVRRRPAPKRSGHPGTAWPAKLPGSCKVRRGSARRGRLAGGPAPVAAGRLKNCATRDASDTDGIMPLRMARWRITCGGVSDGWRRGGPAGRNLWMRQEGRPAPASKPSHADHRAPPDPSPPATPGCGRRRQGSDRPLAERGTGRKLWRAARRRR